MHAVLQRCVASKIHSHRPLGADAHSVCGCTLQASGSLAKGPPSPLFDPPLLLLLAPTPALLLPLPPLPLLLPLAPPMLSVSRPMRLPTCAAFVDAEPLASARCAGSSDLAPALLLLLLLLLLLSATRGDSGRGPCRSPSRSDSANCVTHQSVSMIRFRCSVPHAAARADRKRFQAKQIAPRPRPHAASILRQYTFRCCLCTASRSLLGPYAPAFLASCAVQSKNTFHLFRVPKPVAKSPSSLHRSSKWRQLRPPRRPSAAATQAGPVIAPTHTLLLQLRALRAARSAVPRPSSELPGFCASTALALPCRTANDATAGRKWHLTAHYPRCILRHPVLGKVCARCTLLLLVSCHSRMHNRALATLAVVLSLLIPAAHATRFQAPRALRQIHAPCIVRTRCRAACCSVLRCSI